MTLQSWRAYAVCEEVLAWAQTMPTLQVASSLLSTLSPPVKRKPEQTFATPLEVALWAPAQRSSEDSAGGFTGMIDAAYIPEAAAGRLSLSLSLSLRELYETSRTSPPAASIVLTCFIHTHTPALPQGNVIHYNIVLSALAKQRDGWRRAEALYAEMRAQGVEPQTQTFAALAGAYAGGGQLEKAMSVLHQPAEHGASSASCILCHHARLGCPAQKKTDDRMPAHTQRTTLNRPILSSRAVASLAAPRTWLNETQRRVPTLRQIEFPELCPTAVQRLLRACGGGY